MRLLALSDLHGDYSKIEAIRKHVGDIDAVLIAGDITDFGPDQKALELIGMFHVPVLIIPGNCDHPSILKTLEGSDAINLHKACYTIQDVNFIGLGGSNPTPFNTPFELEEEDIEQTLKTLLDKYRGSTTVLLSHAPPYGFGDELPAGHVGSPAIARFMDSLALIVCGHIHEARGTARAGNTTIVNVGESSHGYGALITIDKNICVEPIKV